MSSIQFLAASKHQNSSLIEGYNHSSIYETGLSFSVHEADQWWCEVVKPVLSMPYIYEVEGIGNHYFFVYLEKYMELGDVIDL